MNGGNQHMKNINSNSAPHERLIVTLSENGFIKNVPSGVYRALHRRGVGVKGMPYRVVDADNILVEADRTDDLYFFTETGRVYQLKCQAIPACTSRTGSGTAISSLITITEGDRVTAIVPVSDLKSNYHFIMASREGKIKKSRIQHFGVIGSRGSIAMEFEKGDELVAVSVASDEDTLILVTEQGQSIRFDTKSLFSSSLLPCGVPALQMKEGDKLASLDVVVPEAYLLTVTANGYGKLTPVTELKFQIPGGKSSRTLTVTEKTGKVVDARIIKQTQHLMLATKNGITLSTPLKDEDGSIMPNYSQGVMLIKMDVGDCLATLAVWE
jgi:DNA gyrase subunit A